MEQEAKMRWIILFDWNSLPFELHSGIKGGICWEGSWCVLSWPYGTILLLVGIVGKIWCVCGLSRERERCGILLSCELGLP